MRNLFCFILLVISFSGIAQIQFSQKTIWTIEDISSKVNPDFITDDFVESELIYYPIYKVNGKYCLSMVGITNANFQNEDLNQIAFLGSKIGNIITLKCPLEHLSELALIKNVKYLEVADRIAGPANNKMVVDTRVDSVWEGIGLSQPYTGKNVLIGITDWGFDYGHPMFMDTTLTYSRIRAAWDHFKLDGDQPVGFNYGVEYDTPSELATAESDTASTYYDYATHGSHVAGICAGSGAGTKYRGVAFEAQYLFNSIRLDVGSAIDAFNWMKSIADADGKRLVINMSWGLYYLGTMDGTSLVSQAIDILSDQGVVFVTSGGNNGDPSFHIKKDFASDTLRSRIQFYGYNLHPNMWGESISSWGEIGETYSMQLEVYDGSGVLLDSTPTYSTQEVGYHDSILKIGIDTVFYNYTIESSHPLNSRPMIWARVKNTNTNYRVVLKSFGDAGRVHYWNVVELDNGVGNWGQAFSSYGNGGVNGDTEYGVGEPACTESAITVAAHTSANFSQSGIEYPGNIAYFSSHGPTYDERMKPDVSAPGTSVVSSINSYTTASYSTAYSINFNGKDYDFSAFSGTSMSSPATAGVVALILEASPLLTPEEVKDVLKSTARQDNKTGVITAPGSTIWGMGKVTATAALALAEATAGIEVYAHRNDNIFQIYPNPTNGIINIVNQKESVESIWVEIYSLDGKLVLKEMLPQESLSLEQFEKGIYVMKVEQSGVINTFRIVIN